MMIMKSTMEMNCTDASVSTTIRSRVSVAAAASRGLAAPDSPSPASPPRIPTAASPAPLEFTPASP